MALQFREEAGRGRSEGGMHAPYLAAPLTHRSRLLHLFRSIQQTEVPAAASIVHLPGQGSAQGLQNTKSGVGGLTLLIQAIDQLPQCWGELVVGLPAGFAHQD